MTADKGVAPVESFTSDSCKQQWIDGRVCVCVCLCVCVCVCVHIFILNFI